MDVFGKVFGIVVSGLKKLFGLQKQIGPEAAGSELPPVVLAKIALPDPRTSKPPASENRLKLLVARCREIGTNLALAARDREVIEENLAMAEEAARAIALAETLSPEQWTTVLQQIKQDLLSAERTLKGCEDGSAEWQAELARRQEARGLLDDVGACPAAERQFVLGAIAGISISIAGSVHDLLPALFPELRWPLAVGASAGIASLITKGILPGGSEEGGMHGSSLQPKSHGVVGGVITGIGFLAIRAAMGADPLMLAGCTLLEFGAVWFLDQKAKELYPKVEQWRDGKGQQDIADGAVRVAVMQVDRYKTSAATAALVLGEIRRKLDEHVSLPSQDTVVENSISAARLGYIEQVARIKASTLGLPEEAK